MWRSTIGQVIYKQVGLLRNSSECKSSRIFSIHISSPGHSDGNVRQVTDSQNVVTNENVTKAQSTIIGLVLKLHDGYNDKPTIVEARPLIQHLLDQFNKHTNISQESNKDFDLTICTPKTGRNGKGSRFGFKNVFMDFEQWCYGVVVVSSLISWHQLLFKDGRKTEKNKDSTVWNINNFVNFSKPLRVLPVNSPAKPIDPLDAACSSLKDTMTGCTAVAENVLAIQYLKLKLYEKAFMLFKKASEKGNKEAHFNVALCYEEGIGTPPDIAKAVNSYTVAVLYGHKNAAFNLGIIFLQGKHYPGKEKDGLEMMEKAAEGGLVKAQRFLGLYYADDSNNHYDMTKSVKWLTMASEQKDMKAQYHLGICYERGLGVLRNMQKAREMYCCAAENGHTAAKYNYAIFHEQGLGGLCIDKHEALRWYEAAADDGNKNAKQIVHYLKKEINSEKRTPTLVERFLSNIWIPKEATSTTADDVLPRCSSSPGNLFMQSDASSYETISDEQQSITHEDGKCIWVI